MENVRRVMTLMLSFLIVTMAVAVYTWGLGDTIDNFDAKKIEQSFTNYNWNYSY